VGLKNDGGVVQIQSTDLVVDGNLNVSGKFFVRDIEYENRVSNLETVLGFNSTSNSSIRVNSFNKEVVIDGHLNVSGTIFTQNQNISEILSELQSLAPPKCVPPGGDKLRFDGEKWICVCINSYYYGDECQYKTPYEPVTDDDIYAECYRCLGVSLHGLCYDSPNGPMPEWNVSLVTNMESLFIGGRYSFFNVDISKWDTSSVTNMNRMFSEASLLNQDIGSWNTAKVTGMASMFYRAFSFNHYIGDWDTSKLSSYLNIFQDATAFRAKYLRQFFHLQRQTFIVQDCAFYVDCASASAVAAAPITSFTIATT
jgi:surface protein